MTVLLGKGRYLKAAERACARKSRFETAAAAEAFVERRYRAYRCVVCGKYHLTSGRGERAEPESVKKEPPGPKLGDLDWSAVFNPRPKSVRITAPPAQIDSSSNALSQGDEMGSRIARCVGAPGKDGRVLLVVEGRLVKSRPVERGLRGLLQEDSLVEVDGVPPRILGLSKPKD